MTVIVCRDGVMAADGASWQDDIITGFDAKKICRTSDGDIYACAGSLTDITTFRSWMDDGRQGDRPKTTDAFGVLWLKNDGKLFRIVADGAPYEIPGQWAIEGCHSDFLHGALAAGASAEDAVRLAVKHCPNAAGEIQVERLHL